MNKGLFKFSIRDITEIAVMCALAIAFDRFLNIKIGATGGSLSIACLPLFIVSYRHGWFKGFVSAGIVFGLTTCILDAYGFQYFVFDYFIAFGCIGLAGLFGKPIYKYICEKEMKKKLISISLIILTVAIYFIIRVLSASVDSMIFYQYTLGASLIYNVGYVGPSCIAIIIFLIILLPSLISINTMYPTEFLKEEKKEEVDDNKKTNLEF